MDDSERLGSMHQRLAWYQQAKFGMFIHWGAYSVAGVEASWPIMAPNLAEAMFRTTTRISEDVYTTLPARFNPVDFDADKWVRMAQSAGMRYIVFTAKHHDGFCMFEAPGTDYKITRTPYGKDICLELAQACARAGMPLGFYYSPPDMHHPAYRDTARPATANWLGEAKRRQWADYLDYMEAHIRTLLTNYGDVRVIWFDGLAHHAKYDPPRFHRLIHEISPNTLINDRLGDGYDFITPEQFIPSAGIPVRTGKPPAANEPSSEGFFRLVGHLYRIPGLRTLIRQQIHRYADGKLELTRLPNKPCPSPDRFQPWETCMTIGRTWAHNPNETVWKPPEQLVRNLVEVVSRGGNYLLNVGPTAQGVFPTEAVERLRAVGRWMDTHHEAIYGATYTPLQGLSWGRATRVGDRIYLFVFDWPADNRIKIADFPGQARGAAVLGGESLSFSQSGQSLVVSLPARPSDTDTSVLAIGVGGATEGKQT